MGIYIQGMEMPSNCEVCPLNYDSIDCMVADNVLREKGGGDFLFHHERHPNCPLVPVPDHGRAIDADALAEMLENYKKEYALKAKEDIAQPHKAWGLLHKAFGLHEAELMAESLPTIIPAEEAKE